MPSSRTVSKKAGSSLMIKICVQKDSDILQLNTNSVVPMRHIYTSAIMVILNHLQILEIQKYPGAGWEPDCNRVMVLWYLMKSLEGYVKDCWAPIESSIGLERRPTICLFNEFPWLCWSRDDTMRITDMDKSEVSCYCLLVTWECWHLGLASIPPKDSTWSRKTYCIWIWMKINVTHKGKHKGLRKKVMILASDCLSPVHCGLLRSKPTEDLSLSFCIILNCAFQINIWVSL